VLNATHVLRQRHRVFLAYRKPEIGDRFSIPKYWLPFRHEADLQSLWQIVSIIKTQRIDVVVPTKRKEYFLAGMACKLTGVKNIIILGIVRDLKNTVINNLIYNWLADGIMVNAQMIKDVLLYSSYMKAEKIAVIPNSIAIDVESVQAAPKKFDFTISSLAELSTRKGFDFLLRGFACFIKQYCITNAGIVIIGSGNELENLKLLSITLGIEHLVIFTGFLKDPYPYLLSSTVFAMTSKNEGIPYAIIEAALLDNAIITTKAGGIEELLKDNKHCLYVSYADESLFASQLYRLYSDATLRKQLAENAHQAAIAKFSLEKMEMDMIGFFQEIQKKGFYLKKSRTARKIPI